MAGYSPSHRVVWNWNRLSFFPGCLALPVFWRLIYLSYFSPRAWFSHRIGALTPVEKIAIIGHHQPRGMTNPWNHDLNLRKEPQQIQQKTYSYRFRKQWISDWENHQSYSAKSRTKGVCFRIPDRHQNKDMTPQISSEYPQFCTGYIPSCVLNIPMGRFSSPVFWTSVKSSGRTLGGLHVFHLGALLWISLATECDWPRSRCQDRPLKKMSSLGFPLPGLFFRGVHKERHALPTESKKSSAPQTGFNLENSSHRASTIGRK